MNVCSNPWEAYASQVHVCGILDLRSTSKFFFVNLPTERKCLWIWWVADENFLSINFGTRDKDNVSDVEVLHAHAATQRGSETLCWQMWQFLYHVLDHPIDDAFLVQKTRLGRRGSFCRSWEGRAGCSAACGGSTCCGEGMPGMILEVRTPRSYHLVVSGWYQHHPESPRVFWGSFFISRNRRNEHLGHLGRQRSGSMWEVTKGLGSREKKGWCWQLVCFRIVFSLIKCHWFLSSKLVHGRNSANQLIFGEYLSFFTCLSWTGNYVTLPYFAYENPASKHLPGFSAQRKKQPARCRTQHEELQRDPKNSLTQNARVYCFVFCFFFVFFCVTVFFSKRDRVGLLPQRVRENDE